MVRYRTRDGREVQTQGAGLGSRSAEGNVYETDRPGLVAKIYHKPSKTRREKLEAMLLNPVTERVAHTDHVSVAWPRKILVDGGGSFCGFLMPAVRGAVTPFTLSHPRARRLKAPGESWRRLHVMAGNLAHAVALVHEAGHVIGDFNIKNVLVTDRALVTLVDCDSFQIKDPIQKRYFPATKGLFPGYSSPEYIRSFKTQPVTLRTPEQDNFVLAIFVFLLLLNYHPFTGGYASGNHNATDDDLIEQGDWAFGTGGVMRPHPLLPRLDDIDPGVAALLRKAFEEGHHVAERRPKPTDWIRAIRAAEQKLVQCSANANHQYTGTSSGCPWCRIVRLGHDDPFPGLSHPSPGARSTSGGRPAGRKKPPSRASAQTRSKATSAAGPSSTRVLSALRWTAAAQWLKGWWNSLTIQGAVVAVLVGVVLLVAIANLRQVGEPPVWPRTSPTPTNTVARPTNEPRAGKPAVEDAQVVDRASPHREDDAERYQPLLASMESALAQASDHANAGEYVEAGALIDGALREMRRSAAFSSLPTAVREKVRELEARKSQLRDACEAEALVLRRRGLTVRCP